MQPALLRCVDQIGIEYTRPGRWLKETDVHRQITLIQKIFRVTKSCMMPASTAHPNLPKAERLRLFSGHCLRAGLALSAEEDECFVQKQLGQANANDPPLSAQA